MTLAELEKATMLQNRCGKLQDSFQSLSDLVTKCIANVDMIEVPLYYGDWGVPLALTPEIGRALLAATSTELVKAMAEFEEFKTV